MGGCFSVYSVSFGPKSKSLELEKCIRQRPDVDLDKEQTWTKRLTMFRNVLDKYKTWTKSLTSRVYSELDSKCKSLDQELSILLVLKSFWWVVGVWLGGCFLDYSVSFGPKSKSLESEMFRNVLHKDQTRTQTKTRPGPRA